MKKIYLSVDFISMSLWNFETITGSLLRHNWPKLASLVQKKTLHSSSIEYSLLPKYTYDLFKNIFDFTTAGEWDCVAVVEGPTALHYSVDFMFLSFGIIDSILKLRKH